MVRLTRGSHKAMELLLSVALLVACGGDQKSAVDEQLGVDNVHPEGSVGGQVIDAQTDQPLAGVSVTVVAGAFTGRATTDGSGLFAVEGVPASGSVLATLSKSGYLTADLTAAFNNAAGQFPVDNATVTFGPIGLIPSTGSFQLSVFDASGRPAQGHVITMTTRVRYLNLQSGSSVSTGSVTVTGQVDGNGRAVFHGLPDYFALGRKVDSMVDVAVPAYDADGDGYFEFPGRVYSFDVLSLGNAGNGSPETTLVLDPTGSYPSSLRIVASNVQALEGWPAGTYAPDTIPPVGPIYVLFNQPVDPDSLAVAVFDETGTVAHDPNVQVTGSSVEITFPTALGQGAEYNLRITARAATGDLLATGSFSAPFFVIDEGAPVTIEFAMDDPLDPTNHWCNVTFSEPVGFGMPNTALGGSDSTCVIFFDFNLVGPGPQPGDDPGEWGNETCFQGGQYDVRLTPMEPDPVQPGGVGRSGYTKYWRFWVPNVANQSTPLPSGTPVHFAFNHVDSSGYVMRRANGEPLPEMVQNLP